MGEYVKDVTRRGEYMQRMDGSLNPHPRWSSLMRLTSPDRLTLVILNEGHEPTLAGTTLSALHVVRLLRSRGVSVDVLIIDNATSDGSLCLARQIEALHYADGVALVALARRDSPAGIREYAIRHALGRYIVLLPAGGELEVDNIGAFYETIVATRAAVVYGYVIVHGRILGDILPSVGTPYQANRLPAGDIPHLAMIDRIQILDAGGYLNIQGTHYAVDWECYAHLAANGRRTTFVPLVFGAVHTVSVWGDEWR